MKDQQEHQPQHRHHNRHENFRHQNNRKPDSSKKIGQIFGLVYHVLLVYFVFDLAKSGNEKLALEIFSINAALVIFAGLFLKRSFKNRDDYRKKNFRHQNRSRNDQNRNRA